MIRINEIVSQEPEIHIPETIENYPVVKFIGDIPNTLETLYLPKTLEKFCIEAYWIDYKLNNIYVDEDNKSLTSTDGILYNKDMTMLIKCPYARDRVTIPRTVTKIKQDAFAYTNVRKIDIPDSVKVIQNAAFYYCKKLKSVKLSKNIKKIDFHTFFGCDKLKKVIIPANVEVIKKGAFFDCNTLKVVKFEKGSRLKEISGFGSCSSLKSIKIPKGVKIIGDGAFAFCDKLSKVTLPDTVESINANAFDWCMALKSVELPESVQTIGYRAFRRCTGIRKFTVKGEALKHIDSRAFTGISKSLRKKIQFIAKENSYVYLYAKKLGFKVMPL